MSMPMGNKPESLVARKVDGSFSRGGELRVTSGGIVRVQESVKDIQL